MVFVDFLINIFIVFVNWKKKLWFGWWLIKIGLVYKN